MKIAFIVTHYYPYMDAVGNCVDRVIKELPSSYNIDILCLNSYDKNAIIPKHTNCEIIFCNSNFNSFVFEKVHSKILSILLRCFRFLTIVFSKNMLRKDIEIQISKVLECKEYDAIVPCMYPVEGIVAALNSKCKNVIPYMFDNFVECDDYYRFPILRKMHYSSNFRLMKRILEQATSVIATPTFKSFFDKNFSTYSINYCEHPLLCDRISGITYKRKDSLCFLYAGSLVRNYIIADFCVNFLKLASEEIEITAKFYIGGNAVDVVKDASFNYPQIYSWSNFIPRDQLLNEFCNYDIFISIAEKKGKQFSSKIFDYISTGKPIVHFYTAEDDINLAALRKYPNALLIKETPEIKNEDIKRFVKFISAEHKPINFKYLKEIYADANPKYTSDLLISIIENNGGN